MNNKRNDNLIIGINLGDYGSTGNIMLNSLEYAHKNGSFDVLALIPYETQQKNIVRTISFSAKICVLKHIYYVLLRKIKLPIINDGNYYNEYTAKLIAIIIQESKHYKNTIIHLHNLHMCNLNVSKLYKWLHKHNEYNVIYSLYDCWAFTGGCYHYSSIHCYQWEKECSNCPLKIKYAHHQLITRTKQLLKIKNLIMNPTSHWMELQLSKSKLHPLPSIMIYSETNLKRLKRNETLLAKYNLYNKKIVLAVGAYWNEWKGTKYLYEIHDKLPDNYKLIIIGSGIDKEKCKNAITIKQVNQITELPLFFEIADVYVSVTQAETLGLTTCEAQICGTPVVMFGHCGSIETIINGKTGIVVGDDNNVDKMITSIKHIVEDKPFKEKDIVESGNRFKKYEASKKYLLLYEQLTTK